MISLTTRLSDHKTVVFPFLSPMLRYIFLFFGASANDPVKDQSFRLLLTLLQNGIYQHLGVLPALISWVKGGYSDEYLAAISAWVVDTGESGLKRQGDSYESVRSAELRVLREI